PTTLPLVPYTTLFRSRVDVAVGRVVAAGAGALCLLAIGELLAPALEAVGGLGIDGVDQLLQHALAIAHDRDVDIARGAAELLGRSEEHTSELQSPDQL